MKVKVLASGSKGNVSIIEVGNHHILIDAGLPLNNIIKRINEPFPSIDIMIITHTHTDHIKGIKSYINLYNPQIYTKTKKLEKVITSNKIHYDNYIDDNVSIKLFELSHDTPCSGIEIDDLKNNKSLIYITDTGYINRKIISQIKDKNIYIIESNHDVEKLRHGKYPYFLQQRILGDEGHLSNKDSARYLKSLIGPHTKNIVLAHLSEENNTYDLALEEARKVVNDQIILTIAKQDEALEVIEV